MSRDQITDRLFYTGAGLGLVTVLGAGVALVLQAVATAQTHTLLTMWTRVVGAISLALGVIACVVLLMGRARLRRTIPRR